MVSNFTVHDTNLQTVVNTVKEVFMQSYGKDGMGSSDSRSSSRIYAKDVNDLVKCSRTPDGIKVDLSNAALDTAKDIRNRLGDGGDVDRGFDTGREIRDERPEPDTPTRTEVETEDTVERVRGADREPDIEQEISELPTDVVDDEDVRGAGTIREVYSDGHYEFMPPFDKSEAVYYPPGQGNNPSWDCKDCAHYIEGGGCHLVAGGVSPDGHCEEFYSDIGVYARVESNLQKATTTLRLWGERFSQRFSRETIEQTVENFKEDMIDRL
jgi:hypothetical protein